MKTAEYIRGLQVARAAMERPDDFMPSARIIAKALIEADGLIQAQHEATWAMAMEAVAMMIGNLGDQVSSPEKHWLYDIEKRVKQVPCPPLNTNPTKDGE